MGKGRGCRGAQGGGGQRQERPEAGLVQDGGARGNGIMASSCQGRILLGLTLRALTWSRGAPSVHPRQVGLRGPPALGHVHIGAGLQSLRGPGVSTAAVAHPRPCFFKNKNYKFIFLFVKTADAAVCFGTWQS